MAHYNTQLMGASAARPASEFWNVGALEQAGGSSDGMVAMAAAGVCAAAIGSVPVFSNSDRFSFIPQALAALAVGLACLTLLKRIPRIHVAVMAYTGLVAFWGITLLSEPEIWPEYRTLLKVCVLALAAHVIFRSPRQILLLFAIYTATGLVTLAMNWDEIHVLGASISGAQLSEKDRFAGTFLNANSAGTYGVVLMLSGLIMFFNGRGWWRWSFLLIGLLTGLSICFFSGSRKAMLGLAFLAVIVPWMAGPSRKTRQRSIIRALAAMVVTLALVGLVLSNLPFVNRLLVPFTEGIAADSSSETRFAMLVKAFELWAANPFFGCGFDGFSRLSEFGVYSHTTFGEVLCNGGIFGFSLLAIFYLLPAVQLLRLARSANGMGSSRLTIGLFAFWGVFTLFSFFAVLFDSREYVPISAAICAYLQEQRGQQWYATEKM